MTFWKRKNSKSGEDISGFQGLKIEERFEYKRQHRGVMCDFVIQSV